MTPFRLERQTIIAAAVHGLLFLLVVTGVLPRWVSLPWAAILAIWSVIAPLRVTIPFFIAAIPFFIALPVSPTFDSLNMWRLVAIGIGVRWVLDGNDIRRLRPGLFGYLLIAFMGLIAISAIGVTSWEPSVRRIILLLNALIVPVIAHAACKQDRSLCSRALGAMALSVVAVTVVAIAQLFATYIMDIYAFMRVWGEGIQLRQFGSQWSAIVVGVGNTWFAYYGPQLSLRVFSVFTDSHTFPMYVVFGIAGLLPIAIRPVTAAWRSGATYLRLIRTRGAWSMLWVAGALLMVILSGTRGIWAAFVGLPFIGLGSVLYVRRSDPARARLLAYITTWLLVFVVLFAVAWPIATSPQFLLQKLDADLFGARLRSVIDFGETSNSARIAIWRATLASIAEHPLLGVGPAQFPLILDQDVSLGRAGSSAHNIWLHIASESGLPAVVLFMVMYGLLWVRAWRIAVRDRDPDVSAAMAWTVLSLPWIAAYLLTDAALLDERMLLQFGTLAAVVNALDV